MEIAVLPNLDKRGASEAVEKMGKIFKELGVTAYLPDNIFSNDYKHLPEKKLYEIADIIITVGGDGTIIRYGKIAAKYQKPILGVNAGRMGYLATVEPNELNMLNRLVSGNYAVEDRMMLSIEVEEPQKEKSNFFALNDAVITSGFISRIIDIKAYFGADCVSYRADGLIVSTPTGSTAYSMSAGGPIVDATCESIGITPICSHSLSAKPIILNKNSVVKFKAMSLKHADIYLSVDGRKAGVIKPETTITVSRANYSMRLIRFGEKTFYKTIAEKF